MHREQPSRMTRSVKARKAMGMRQSGRYIGTAMRQKEENRHIERACGDDGKGSRGRRLEPRVSGRRKPRGANRQRREKKKMGKRAKGRGETDGPTSWRRGGNGETGERAEGKGKWEEQASVPSGEREGNRRACLVGKGKETGERA